MPAQYFRHGPGIPRTLPVVVDSTLESPAPGSSEPEDSRAERQRRTRAFELAIVAALGVFGTLTYLVRRGGLLRWDLPLTQRLQRVRLPGFGLVMRLVSLPGFPPFSYALVAATATTLWLRRWRLEALYCLSTFLASAFSGLVKLGVGRPRPDQQLVRVWFPLQDHSFPSGHTVHYVTFYGFVFYLAYAYLKPSRLRTLILVLTGSLIALVGPSRIYNGQHWASDVLAAYSLGLAHLAGTIESYRWLKWRLTRPGPNGGRARQGGHARVSLTAPAGDQTPRHDAMQIKRSTGHSPGR
jgi:membrane-associated phospholipid phosphatase